MNLSTSLLPDVEGWVEAAAIYLAEWDGGRSKGPCAVQYFTMVAFIEAPGEGPDIFLPFLRGKPLSVSKGAMLGPLQSFCFLHWIFCV